MNPDQYRETIQQLAEVDWTNPIHPVVKKLLTSETTCEDCGRVCQGHPVRTLIRTRDTWVERCNGCHLYRSDAGVFELKSRISLKRASDSDSSPQKKSNRQSQPIAHVTNSCPDPCVVPASPVPIAESEISIHPYPVSPDPSDHLRLDISIHKC
jgi:hypothetical protein